MQDRYSFRQVSFAIRREKADDWMHATLTDADAKKITQARGTRADVFEFEKDKAFICKVIADPRTIDTAQGPWEVMDVVDQKGTQWLVSLGHTVLAKQIRERQTRQGTLVKNDDTGVLVILPLGQPKGKKYFDYVVKTLAEIKAAK